MELLFLFLNLAFAFLVFFLTIAFITGAPFVPSTTASTRALIRLSHIRSGTQFYDLGSGDGRLLLEAAKLGAIAHGIEINPFLVILTRIHALLSPYRSNIHVQWGNFWTVNLKNADVISVYLLPWRMDKLEKMLQEHTRKGTLIVSNSFIFPNLKRIDHDKKTHVYAFKT